MSLRIIKAGILDTVQDLGRYGYQHLGINPGGAMDRSAARIANTLVGNEADEAVLEMHFPASVILFEKETLLTITGADFSPTLNGEMVPLLHPVIVSKNSILQFQRKQSGARCYLSVKGGFEIPEWLNSAGTNLKAGTGGFHGRSLVKDDVIICKQELSFTNVFKQKGFNILPWSVESNLQTTTNDKIRLLTGFEWSWLSGETHDRFLSQAFFITPSSDRMGYRLRGHALELANPEELVSSAVSFGTIQLLPDGQLIVLMADHQTTGGYPRIGHVITADHSVLAQMNPGQSIHFEITDQHTAEELLVKQHQHLQQLENACKFRLDR